MDKREVAVFDFDGTLIREDSFITFAIHSLGRYKFFAGILRTLPSLLAWKLRLKNNGYAKERLFAALYGGKSFTKIADSATKFAPKYRYHILNRLRKHQRSGAHVYIITASLDIWMQHQADKLGVKLICTQADITADGIISGRFSSPNCYGKEKLRRLLREEPDRENYLLTVYGDSAGDFVLFNAADVVHKV